MADKRSGEDRRKNPDRRKGDDAAYTGPEKRETQYRRLDIERRSED